jgi:DnaJ-class molecular chaperone
MLRALLLLAAALALPVQAGEVPKPAVKIENPGSCIRPAEEMRRTHMDLLKHQRNLTMREGVRGGAKSASLNGCIECHASKATGSVRGSKEAFCQGCHEYAAVSTDCWDCHQPKTGYKATGAKP